MHLLVALTTQFTVFYDFPFVSPLLLLLLLHMCESFHYCHKVTDCSVTAASREIDREGGQSGVCGGEGVEKGL